MARDERVDELLALSAVGALTADEARELETLLAGDPDATAELAEFNDAATTLAESTAEAPPAQLRDAVLNAVRPDSTRSHAPSNVVPIHHRRWMIPATAVAAAVLLIVGGLVIERIADAPTDDDIEEVLNDPRASTVTLAGTMGELELVKSSAHDKTVLVGRGIEAPDAEHVFQLWAMMDGQPVSMGTFMPTGTGDVALVMDRVSPPDTPYAVTIEPTGGSAQPTGDHVADSV